MSAVRAVGSEGELTEPRGADVPCSGLRKELLECLRGSDCVKVVSVFALSRGIGLPLFTRNQGFRGCFE